MKTGELVIYVDESGSPDVFSNAGEDLLAAGKTPNYLVIAALRCPDPNVVARRVRSCIVWADQLQGRVRRRGSITSLHAAKDDEPVRAHVCAELASLPAKATVIVMDKRLLDPSLLWRNDRTVFYNQLASYLLEDSLHLHARTRIIFSRKNYETAADLRSLADELGRRWLTYGPPRGLPIPSQVSANQVVAASNPGLQAVDYVAWAVFRAFERGDMTYYNALQPMIRHVWDLGRLTHYSRKNPMKNPP